MYSTGAICSVYTIMGRTRNFLESVLGEHTMTSRRLAALTAAAIILILSPVPALALEYPPPPPTLTVSAGTITVGGSVVVSGRLGPNDTVTVSVNYGGGGGGSVPEIVPLPAVVVATTSADDAGNFSATVRLTRTGRATITATGSPSGLSASVTVRVLARAGGIPTTGASGERLGTMLAGGAGAVALGALLLWLTLARRRRPTAGS